MHHSGTNVPREYGSMPFVTHSIVARVSGAIPGKVPHVAEFIIGPRFARTRWLMRATTTISQPRLDAQAGSAVFAAIGFGAAPPPGFMWNS
jgi:hypothetical protein